MVRGAGRPPGEGTANAPPAAGDRMRAPVSIASGQSTPSMLFKRELRRSRRSFPVLRGGAKRAGYTYEHRTQNLHPVLHFGGRGERPPT